MESASNPNFFGDCESHGISVPDDWNTVLEQNLQANNVNLTTSDPTEWMMQRPVYSNPFLHGCNSGGNNSINLVSHGQNRPGTNQTNTGAGVEDPAAVQLQKKRKAKTEADRRCREKAKKQREDMESKVKTLEAETKSLKEQLDLKNGRCETQQKKLDKLGEDLDELKKNYKEQCERNQLLEAENGTLKDKYIKLLEKCNSLDPRFGTRSNEPDQQRGPVTNLSSERDFGGSGIDSITQGQC